MRWRLKKKLENDFLSFFDIFFFISRVQCDTEIITTYLIKSVLEAQNFLHLSTFSPERMDLPAFRQFFDVVGF